MNRWVGLGVIADNVVNIGRLWKAGTRLRPPATISLNRPAGHPSGILLCPPLGNELDVGTVGGRRADRSPGVLAS
jgi:hypothetical protein